MTIKLHLDEDMHVHSVFSDGKSTLEANVARACSLGLRRMVCVDHVRRDTRWLPEFITEVTRLRRRYPMIELEVGVEAKIASVSGRLDLPRDLTGVDRIYAADHRLPWCDVSLVPRQVKLMLAEGTLTRQSVISLLVDSTARSMRRHHEKLVVAHLFSFLPKVGICESEVSEQSIRKLAATALQTGAVFEIDERWRCPSVRVAKLLADEGVPLWASTDAHHVDKLGQYDYVAEVAATLQGETYVPPGGLEWAA